MKKISMTSASTRKRFDVTINIIFFVKKYTKKRDFLTRAGSLKNVRIWRKVTLLQQILQIFHDNNKGGLSMATNNSRSSAFRPITSLFSGAHINNFFSGARRQRGVQNKPLGVAILGESESILPTKKQCLKLIVF